MRLSRQIKLEKLANTRDLGGIKTMDGLYIRPCRLIRSGTLGEASPEDIRKLAGEYRLGTIVDFRTMAERKQKPDPEIDGVENIFNPILDEATVGITFEKEENPEAGGQPEEDPLASLVEHASSLDANSEGYIDKLYRDLATDGHAVSHYSQFFDILLNADERAVLWHCSAGKDRVGVGTAMLLLALGVDRETVLADFIETNEFVAEGAEAAAAAVLEKTGDPKLADCIKTLLTVSDHYLLNTFSAMEAAGGTVDKYLETYIGLTSEKKARLREKFLTGTDPLKAQ